MILENKEEQKEKFDQDITQCVKFSLSQNQKQSQSLLFRLEDLTHCLKY